MKKLLFLFLSVSFIFTACKKEEGCTDPIATNYNLDAEEDASSVHESVSLRDDKGLIDLLYTAL